MKPARTGLASAHEAVLEGERVIISLGDVGLPASRVGSGTLEKGSLRLRSGGGVSLLISHIAFLPYICTRGQYHSVGSPQLPTLTCRLGSCERCLTCTGEKNAKGTRVTWPAATYGASTASRSASAPQRSYRYTCAKPIIKWYSTLKTAAPTTAA